MGVSVTATCSECLTTQYTRLEFGQENIECPACGHKMKNLPEGELNELETTLRKQRLLQTIALACFGVGLVAFIFWVFGPWILPDEQGPLAPRTDALSTTVLPFLSALGLVASLVCGALGSRARYLIEF